MRNPFRSRRLDRFMDEQRRRADNLEADARDTINRFSRVNERLWQLEHGQSPTVDIVADNHSKTQDIKDRLSATPTTGLNWDDIATDRTPGDPWIPDFGAARGGTDRSEYSLDRQPASLGTAHSTANDALAQAQEAMRVATNTAEIVLGITGKDARGDV